MHITATWWYNDKHRVFMLTKTHVKKGLIKTSYYLCSLNRSGISFSSRLTDLDVWEQFKHNYTHKLSVVQCVLGVIKPDDHSYIISAGCKTCSTAMKNSAWNLLVHQVPRSWATTPGRPIISQSNSLWHWPLNQSEALLHYLSANKIHCNNSCGTLWGQKV